MNRDVWRMAAVDAMPFSLLWAKSKTTREPLNAYDRYPMYNGRGAAKEYIGNNVVDVDSEGVRILRHLMGFTSFTVPIIELVALHSILTSDGDWQQAVIGGLIYSVVKTNNFFGRLGSGDVGIDC